MIFYDMSNEEYHLSDAISSTAVKTVSQKSLAHWRFSQRKHVHAFDLGTAVHSLVLEPHLTDAVRCGPETRRGNEWKEMHASATAEGAVLLTESDYQIAVEMSQSVRSNAAAAKLLGGELVCEASVFAKDPVTQLDMRCRPDGWRKDIDALIDLKTTVDASPSGFAKQVANFGYHIQDAFYRHVMLQEGFEIDRFAFIAVEKEPPYAVGVYELDWRSIEEGWLAMKDALERIKSAKETGRYGTGYGDLQTIQIPAWAFRFTENG